LGGGIIQREKSKPLEGVYKTFGHLAEEPTQKTKKKKLVSPCLNCPGVEVGTEAGFFGTETKQRGKKSHVGRMGNKPKEHAMLYPREVKSWKKSGGTRLKKSEGTPVDLQGRCGGKGMQ